MTHFTPDSDISYYRIGRFHSSIGSFYYVGFYITLYLIEHCKNTCCYGYRFRLANHGFSPKPTALLQIASSTEVICQIS